MTGIGYFQKLTYLNCGGNQLTSLNVSYNTALEFLDCSNNSLTSLNLKDTKVTDLDADNNIYAITLGENRTFDLSTLPGVFDLSKASNWSTGATVSGNILTVDSDTTEVTYDYNCENNKTVTFKLSFMPVAASNYANGGDKVGPYTVFTDDAIVYAHWTLQHRLRRSRRPPLP